MDSKMKTGFDSGNGEPLQISWKRRIRNNFNSFIPKILGFSQQNRILHNMVIPLFIWKSD